MIYGEAMQKILLRGYALHLGESCVTVFLWVGTRVTELCINFFIVDIFFLFVRRTKVVIIFGERCRIGQKFKKWFLAVLLDKN